ncbi:MAG: hypothetical protein GXY43_04090 [Clostridiaceae bacterium]|nr:hypothetical protein [Clostridiaceae bacterium]
MKKRTRKKVLIGLILFAAIVAIGASLNYFFIYLPEKTKLVTMAEEFLQAQHTAYVLPEEYRKNPAAVTQEQIDSFVAQKRELCLQFVAEGSDLEKRFIDVMYLLIDDQLSGQLDILGTQVTNEKTLDVKIFEDTASVELYVKIEEQYGYVKTIYSYEKVGFEKDSSGNWIVVSYNYRPAMV